MKKMIFVTTSFPFSIQESSFIRPEIKELLKEFDITIVSRNTADEQTTELPERVRVLRYDSKRGYNPLLLLLRTLLSSAFYKELLSLIKRKKLSFRNIKKAVKYYMRSLHFAAFLKPIREGIDEKTVLYTYWNDYSVMSLSMVKKDGDALISRAHRADLYEREENGFYLPLKAASNKKTDLIAFISDEGKKYFETNFEIKAQKEVFRLGVGEQNPLKVIESDVLSIYSFSYISPVKRVELIAKALAGIDDINIKWTHIGAGVCEKEVKETASRLLDSKSNVKYRFTGAMENGDAMNFISKSDFQVLINVSASEGVPVTMMEAMSFGIPIIATDVGGVSEIVKDGLNGFLIDNSGNIVNDIQNCLVKFNSLSVNEKRNLSENAYTTWAEKYNSLKNETEFTERILSL